MIYALDAQQTTMSLHAPRAPRVPDPVTRHSPQAQHKDSVYFCKIYSVIS